MLKSPLKCNLFGPKRLVVVLVLVLVLVLVSVPVSVLVWWWWWCMVVVVCKSHSNAEVAGQSRIWEPLLTPAASSDSSEVADELEGARGGAVVV